MWGQSFTLTQKKLLDMESMHRNTRRFRPRLCPSRCGFSWSSCLEVRLLGDPVKLLSACWLFLLVGCVRFKHLQQSHLTECRGRLEPLCARGKARVRGAQRPFRWRMPRFGITGVDVFQVWSKLLRNTFQDLKEMGFLLPDFKPKRAIGTCDWSG